MAGNVLVFKLIGMVVPAVPPFSFQKLAVERLVREDFADHDRVAGAVGHAADRHGLQGLVVEEAPQRPAAAGEIGGVP